MTAARIGPAHGAQTKPSAPPTPTPVQKPVPRGVGPNRARRDSGACTRAASSGTSSTMPKPISTMIASVRAAPVARPTPLTSWASATIAIVNVTAEPEHDPERTPPPAGGARRQQRRQHRAARTA